MMPAETITRRRGGGAGEIEYDEDGNPIIPPAVEPIELTPWGIEPGTSEAIRELARNGERIEYAVYLPRTADVLNGDELDMRGETFVARVLDWRSQRTGRGGLVVLATLEEG